ncbi:methyl-accepting chemotaxis protein [Methylomonas sp. SURF-2]|uniref:Methyl-accepting chemotaxis protein n=1 Tax=Methylomonas subterranea TaxID=2952225 RepID=A0ABT1TEC2_9GAMM|nr:methyl-accepting chemotaxis protein [Methylomonas sp. SURF-2]MCQ8103606.1 methyl-accepting chemotaxis protein [Methylomonas sp. SURF-2]
MNKLSIYQKLTLLLAPLLLCVLAYSGISVHNNYRNWRQMVGTEKLINLSVGLGGLTHALQVERGSSFGFIQSGGAKFVRELPLFRAETDRALNDVVTLYSALQKTALPKPVTDRVDTALHNLAMLTDTRQSVSGLDIKAEEAAARYTRAIAEIQAITPAISDHGGDTELIRLMTAYNAFMNAKERSGQERALMTGVFTAGEFTPERYRAFVGHMAAQKAYLHFFTDYAPSEIRKEHRTAEESGPFLMVESMRKAALDNANGGGLGIEATAWFASATARIDAMHVIEKSLAGRIKAMASDKAAAAKQGFWLGTSISAIIFLASTLLAYRVSVSIAGGIDALHATIDRIESNNDLTLRLQVDGSDEIAQTAAAFNRLMDGLHDSMRQVNQSAAKVLHFSESIASSSNRMASGTADLSNAASSMAAAIEEMSASIEQVADNANQVQTITENSNQLSDHGTAVILKVVAEMNGIADAVRQSATKMRELDQQSARINSIVQVIREIADQTNLLALNASIEAARAGDQGRGFAVVADEVRNLSKRTTNSALDIAAMIADMQNVTQEAVSSMNIGVDKVNHELSTTQSAGESIQKIQQGTQHVSVAVADICVAIQEQSMATNEIGRQVERVAQMSEQSNAASNGNAKTAREMEGLASQLQSIVARFKV